MVSSNYNLKSTIDSSLKVLSSDLGINISKCLEDIVILKHPEVPNDKVCGPFYPLQTCSNMCGVIVVCMSGIVCESWNSWVTGTIETGIQLITKPSLNDRQLRLTVISWIVNNDICTNMFFPEVIIVSDNDDCHSDNNSLPPSKEPEIDDNTSDDDFMESDDLASTTKILGMLPDGFMYKMLRVIKYDNIGSFHCTFKLNIDNEEILRKWLAAYNDKSKETMVYESCRNGKGKSVVKKFYLRCQHKQRQTGKHTKSGRSLKTTHKSHNNRNTNCPAQIIATLLSPRKSNHRFGVDVILKHSHNHLVHVADALRFRRMSESTKEKYYDLFRQGHSPSSAHLEYETSVTYSDEPQLIADRNTNPKKSDVYNLFNKWRKSNVGVRTGKQLFTELEKRINAYNDANSVIGGKAVVQRYHKTKGDEQEEPLVLAICTPLMSRVHEYILQSRELVFIDASSSFEDFNNPLFVISTSSAAGGLPLGVVVTSAESASVIHKGMTMLQDLFPDPAFYGNGSPANIMIDDSSAEREFKGCI